MDKKAKIELLKQNSFEFDVNFTLDEIEWTRILGPNGLGNQLLQQMVAIGGEFIDIREPAHVHNGTGEVFGFTLGRDSHQFRLDYEQPLTSNLRTAVKQVLDGVNGALRRDAEPYRFICVRDSCTGAGCTYRLMLLPTAWLRELEDELNIVSGVCLEDYEIQRPSGRPDAGGGFLAAR